MDLLKHQLTKFATLGTSLLMVQISNADDLKPLPRYTLDVRDAPTSAVFAMMLGGTEVTVMRHFPSFVSLRLTEKQVTLPPPDPGRGYGDYWPIGGWLGQMQRSMGVKGMILGFEREGGAFFYASIDGKPPSNSYDFYRIMERGPNDCWHQILSPNKGMPVAPPADVSLSSFRLAGVRWTAEQPTRRAILVVRNKANEAYTRVIQEGDQVGIEGLTVEKIEPAKVTLGRATGELVKLNLQRSR